MHASPPRAVVVSRRPRPSGEEIRYFHSGGESAGGRAGMHTPSSAELIGESERASEEGRERECGRRARAAAVVFLVGHNEKEEGKGEREGGRPWGPLTKRREREGTRLLIDSVMSSRARAHTKRETCNRAAGQRPTKWSPNEGNMQWKRKREK